MTEKEMDKIYEEARDAFFGDKVVKYAPNSDLDSVVLKGLHVIVQRNFLQAYREGWAILPGMVTPIMEESCNP